MVRGGGMPVSARSRGLVLPSTVKPRSQAVLHQVRLQELLAEANVQDSSSVPCSTRLSCHMHVLRELLAEQAFSSLQGLMEGLTRELETCLFTNKLISSKLPPSARNPNPDDSLEAVPYFEALWAKQAELEEAQRETAAALERAKLADAKCAAAVSELKGEGPEADRLNAKIGLLEYELVKARSEVDQLKGRVTVMEKEHEKEVMVIEDEVRRWKKGMDDAKDLLGNLKKENEERENVRQAFSDLQVGPLLPEAPPGSVTPTAGASNMLEEALRIEGQMLVLQNSRIEEYEEQLASATKRGVAKAMRAAFVEELSQLQHELGLLRDHIASEKAKLTDPLSGEARVGLHGKLTGRSAASKYLEISIDGGKTYRLLEDDGVNAAVGMACRVPPGTTHMRWVSASRSQPSKPTMPNMQATGGMGLRPDELIARKAREALDATKPATPAQQCSGPLWDGFRKACNGKLELAVPMRPRALSLPQLLSMLEELMAAKFRIEKKTMDLLQATDIHQKIAKGEDDQEGLHLDPRAYMTLHQFFYEHLRKKYVLQPTILLVAHGMLTAVERERKRHAVVMLVYRVFCGELDEATWRYTMLWRQLLTELPLASIRDFGVFVSTLYPMAREEELEDVVMAYAQHSAEPASAKTTLEFLTGRLLAKQEFRLRKWLKILKMKDAHHRNSFRCEDFISICYKMMPSLKHNLVAQEYAAAAERYGGERVPLESVAYVACCLEAMGIKPAAPTSSWADEGDVSQAVPRLVRVD